MKVIDGQLKRAADLLTQRDEVMIRFNQQVAACYTKARVTHELVERIRKIKDSIHSWEPDDSLKFKDRTPAKKPCLICGQGKRAKIHEQ